MKYKENDCVKLSELSPGQHAGQIVVITAVIEAQNRYEFMIPEVHGSIAENAIECKVSQVPDWRSLSPRNEKVD